MRVFSVVGPFGVGKTTLVLRFVAALHAQGYDTNTKVAFVLNDEGQQVDGQLAGEWARVVALTNGCFTCNDVGELRGQLKTLQEVGIAWVFLEGFGITAGNETLELLKSTSYQYHILALLSERHLAQDQLRYANVLMSHVQVATLGVAVTKTMEADVVGEEVLDFVGTTRPGALTFPLAEAGELPTHLIDLIRSKERVRSLFRPVGACQVCGEDSGGHHDHHHDHGHEGVHGATPYSFALLPEVTLTQVRESFAGLGFIWRVKGAVEGRLFNEVHGEWCQTTDDNRRYVTFYTSRPITPEVDLPLLMSLVVQNQSETISVPGYQQLRAEAGTREATVAEIERLLANSPEEPILAPADGGLSLVTHPEGLQLAKEMSRRESVKEEWFLIVLKACMRYWLKSVQVLHTRRNELRQRDIAINERELGVSLAWWVNRFGQQFGPEIVEATKQARPGQLVARGIMSLRSLNTDPERAYWQCEEYVEALRYGLEHGERREEMLAALEHCLNLAQGSGSEALQKQWQEKFDPF